MHISSQVPRTGSARLRIWTVVLASCAFISSCATTGALVRQRITDATARGDYLAAAEAVRKEAKSYGKRNELLYHLDMGALFHYAARYDSSTRYLNRAADIYTELFTRSLTNEAAAILTNDNVRPYRSKPYELTVLHQMLQLNFLAGGDVNAALVESRRTQLLFNEWDRKDRHDVKYSSDPMFHYFSSIAYDAAGQADDAMISLYHAVDAFKTGPVPLPDQIREYAYHMLVRNGRADDTLKLGLTSASTAAPPQGLTNQASEIVVVGYGGRGPALQEEVWWGSYVVDGLLILHHRRADGETETMTLPAPMLIDAQGRREGKTRSGSTFHIKVSLPALQPLPYRTHGFAVRGLTPAPVRTVTVNDLDAQTQRHMDESRSAVVGRTVVRTVLRTIAAQKTKQQLRTGDPLANLLVNFGTDLLADQLEKADVRSCGLIPATVQVARIPVRPGTYSFIVEARGRNGEIVGTREFTGISVGAREKKFVIYSSLQ